MASAQAQRTFDGLLEASPALPAAEPLKQAARTLAASQPPRLRLHYAQAFCRFLVTEYWTHLDPRPDRPVRPAPIPHRDFGREGLSVAASMAEEAGKAGAEAASYLIGSTYAAMLPEDYRSQHGVFYTPPAVVNHLLDSATSAGIDWASCRALDPACGGGAFLAPLARRMVAAMPRCDRKVVIRNLATRLCGFEIDPFASWMSLVFLDATLNEILGFVAGESLTPVEVYDSLTRCEESDFDLVIGNPPYGRYTLAPGIRERYKRSLFGHANLYSLFLDLAIRKTRPGGVIAYVAPTSFLSGEYFKNLRRLLTEHAYPIALDFISERSGVFDDVLQETLLAVFRRAASPSRVKVSFIEAARDDLSVAKAVELSLPAEADQPWIIPRTRTSAQLAARLRRTPTRLKDWGYKVSTGPLVWNRFKDRLRDHPTHETVPLIWAEAIGADGSFAFRAARRNHAPYFLVHKDEDHLVITRPCVLLQRTTSKEQLRRLIAAELPPDFVKKHGAVTVENHLNMIVPIVEKPAVSTRALAAFLNSSIADQAFRCISGSVAVSAYELESMPLPSLSEMKALEEFLKTSRAQSEIDSLCKKLYRTL